MMIEAREIDIDGVIFRVRKVIPFRTMDLYEQRSLRLAKANENGDVDQVIAFNAELKIFVLDQLLLDKLVNDDGEPVPINKDNLYAHGTEGHFLLAEQLSAEIAGKIEARMADLKKKRTSLSGPRMPEPGGTSSPNSPK